MAVDDEISSTATTTPLTSPHMISPRRVHSRLSRRDSGESSNFRSHRKSEMHLTKEFIDFDVIKGSAFFHTKPANHDKKLVKEGVRRALFAPFHPTYWRQKIEFYDTLTVLYALHVVAIVIYFVFPSNLSVFSAFEVSLPIGLLLIVSIGFGRITSTLQSGDAEPPFTKLYSPTKQPNPNLGNPTRTNVAAPTPVAVGPSTVSAGQTTDTSALASDIAESEASDSTDSDDDSGNSSSSSDEAVTDDQNSVKSYSVPTTPVSMPTPNMFAETAASPRATRPSDAAEHSRRRVTVCVWENGLARKKAMSVAELRNTILAKVKATPPRMVYRKIAHVSSVTLSLVPFAMRCLVKCHELGCLNVMDDPVEALVWILKLWHEVTSVERFLYHISHISIGATIISISSMLSTYFMASLIFTALADAEVTYHRRLMYAKCFTALTSSRRSRMNNLPHFRLKNVVNIKAWISLRGGRTWLKRQGRQRAADEIVSSSFLINMVLLAIMGIQAFGSESSVSGSSSSVHTPTNHAQNLIRIEVTIWCLLSSMFMLRFMMLGSNINKKYQSTSLLLTEQMNVYLRLLVKPHKKDKLLVSNNVLKLASKLLKELNSPNKVSGLTMNPLLYNITRVVVLSAFSSTASEFFGFKLKLWKMKQF